MRILGPLLVLFALLLPVFEGTSNNDPINNKDTSYTLLRKESGKELTEKAPNEVPNLHPTSTNSKPPKKAPNEVPNLHPTSTNSKPPKKSLKALLREQKLEEQRQLLLTLKEQLKNEGISTEFLDKFLKEGSKSRAKIFDRLIKKAKKKIAKSVKRKDKRKRRRRGNKGLKEVKEVNLFSGKNIPSIKSLTGENSRSRVRGALNPCPAGQSRVRGRCRCPYLSSWDPARDKCECVYGTFKDSRGNCRTHF